MKERYDGIRGRGLAFLLLLWLLWFLNFCLRSVFSPLMPLMEDEFAISHARASSLFLFISAGYALSMFLSGIFAGRFGLKRTILVCVYVSAAACLAIPFVRDFSLLYGLGFVMGFSIGLYLPAAVPMITEHFVEGRWARAIAVHDSGANIAVFAVPLISLLFLHFTSWRGVFTMFGTICAVSGVIFHLTVREVKIAHTGGGLLGRLVKRRLFWVMILLWVCAAGANIGIYLMIPLYLTKELSLTMSYANTVLAISRMGGAATAVGCVFLANRFDSGRMMFSALIGAGALTFLTGIAPAYAVGPALLFQAVFVCAFFPFSVIFITNSFEREERGMAMGFIMTAAIIVGGGIIPYLLGLAGDLVSFRLGISSLGVMVILVSGFLFLFGNKS